MRGSLLRLIPAVRCVRFATSAAASEQKTPNDLLIAPITFTQTSYGVPQSLKLVRAFAPERFDETVQLQVRLNIDVRKPGQAIRAAATLPNGTGKNVRIAVFARDAKADEARAAGADIVGAEDLAKQIESNIIEFDRLIATPDMMKCSYRTPDISLAFLFI